MNVVEAGGPARSFPSRKKPLRLCPRDSWDCSCQANSSHVVMLKQLGFVITALNREVRCRTDRRAPWLCWKLEAHLSRKCRFSRSAAVAASRRPGHCWRERFQFRNAAAIAERRSAREPTLDLQKSSDTVLEDRV